MSDIYKNIKNRRKELGMTQKELAYKCGYTDHTTITKIEKGQVDVTFKRLEQIADALDTTVATLVIGESPSPAIIIEMKDLKDITNIKDLQKPKEEKKPKPIVKPGITVRGEAVKVATRRINGTPRRLK